MTPKEWFVIASEWTDRAITYFQSTDLESAQNFVRVRYPDIKCKVRSRYPDEVKDYAYPERNANP